MTGAPWFISSARDALEMGYRCIAKKLNDILARNCPSLAINADPIRQNDSMRAAIDQFRGAMPGLRTLRELPDSNAGISPWTLGYVNDTGNPAYHISLGMDWNDVDPFMFDFLMTGRPEWKADHWQQFIVDPVSKHMEEVRAALDEFARLAGTNGPPTSEGERWPKPKKYANGWEAIASALEQHNDGAFQKRIKQLHERYPSPIQFGGPGTPPFVEQRKLIEWWNSLENRLSEVQSRRDDQRQSTAEGHAFGRDGVVIPEIQGHEKKRRTN